MKKIKGTWRKKTTQPFWERNNFTCRGGIREKQPCMASIPSAGSLKIIQKMVNKKHMDDHHLKGNHPWKWVRQWAVATTSTLSADYLGIKEESTNPCSQRKI